MAGDLFYRSRLFVYSIMAAVGGAAGVSSSAVWPWIIFPFAFAVTAIIFLHKRGKKYGPLLLCLVFLYAGLCLGQIRMSSWQGRGGRQGEVALEGRVEVGCRGDQDNIMDLLKVSRVLEGQGPRPGDCYLLRAQSEGPDIKWGDTLEVRGHLFLFDSEKGGVGGSLIAAEIKVLAHTGNPLLRIAVSYRDALRRQLESGLNADVAGLIEGMLLGDYRLLGSRDLRAFRLSGLIHLCAASGLNVAILAVFILWIGKRFRLSQRTILLCQVPLLLTYALAVGLSVPIERATIVALIAAAAFFTGRDFDFMPAMGAAVFYLVLSDPGAATGVSFQLCFASALGMVLLYRPLCELLGSRAPKVTALLAATLAAQLAVAPLLLFHFGEVSMLAPLANLLALPLVAPVMALGMLSSLLWMAGLPLAGPLMTAAALPTRLILCIARTIASPSWSAIHIFPFSPLWMAVFYPALAISFLHTGKWKIMAGYLMIVMIAAAVLVGGVLPFSAPGADSGTRITFIDVGQGDSSLIQASGSSILIDGGIDEAILARELRSRGVRYLDAVVVSHPESDHIGGLPGALDGCKVGLLVHPGTKTSGLAGKLLSQAEELGIPIRVMRRGDILKVGEVELDALGPPEELPEGTGGNNNALVIRAAAPGFSLLLPGDVEEEGQGFLLRDSRQLDSDILKVPHHGGFSQGSDEFFSAASPQIAVISVGKDNSYGHPSSRTLDSLERCGPSIYRTDLNGDIVIEVLQGGYKVECEHNT